MQPRDKRIERTKLFQWNSTFNKYKI